MTQEIRIEQDYFEKRIQVRTVIDTFNDISRRLYEVGQQHLGQQEPLEAVPHRLMLLAIMMMILGISARD